MGAGFRDLKLDTDWDLELTDGKDLAFTEDAEAIAQHVRIRLQQYRGEWFCDTEAGTAWSELLELGTTDGEVEAEVRRVVDSTPGVARITACTVTRDAPARTVAVAISAVTDAGELFTVLQEV